MNTLLNRAIAYVKADRQLPVDLHGRLIAAGYDAAYLTMNSFHFRHYNYGGPIDGEQDEK